MNKELKQVLTILYTHRDKLIDDNYNHEHYEDCSICGNIDLLNQLISEVRSINIQQDLKVDCCNSPVETSSDKFNLSNEIFPEGSNPWGFKYGFIDTEDVKEFINLLRKQLSMPIAGPQKEPYVTKAQYLIEARHRVLDIIDRLAGEKLI